MSETEFKTRHVRKRVGRNVFDTPPRISVIIPVYNNAGYIRETLDSVVGQKYREHEIIVVNDGSPDTERFERAIKMRLEDIVYIKQRNAGIGAALNTGIEHARGQIIVFLDGADILQPDFLAAQYVFLERHVYDMVYCDAALFGAHSAYRRSLMEIEPSTGEATFDSLLDRSCNVIMSGTMARRKMIVDGGMFEPERVAGHDLHLWLRMAKIGARIGYQRKQMVKHRIRTDVPSNNLSRIEDELEVLERISRTIDLTEQQKNRTAGRIAVLEADLAIEQAKTFLEKGDYREAAVAFRVANRQRGSLKLTVLTWLTRFAPRAVLRFYRSNRSDDVRLAPRQN